MKKESKILLLLMILVFLFAFLWQPAQETLSKYGSEGEEVTSIQTKLKSWGYYDGNVDGIYGWQTVRAVKAFQSKNGLTADGIAGKDTLAMLGISEKNNASSPSANDNNVMLLARVVNGEARGECYEGQVAVAAVILNRVSHTSFPNSIAGVVYQPGAFEAVQNGQVDTPVEISCRNAARDAMNGWDPTGGAIYYYNPSTASNQWIRSRPILTTIGKHVFCM